MHGGRHALRRDHHRHRRGRRDARLPPRPVGQAHPVAGARRLPAARARELGLAHGLRRGQVSHRRDVAGRPGNEFHRAAVLRGRQHEVLRRRALPLARGGLRRDLATTAASRPPGRSRYDEMEPYYTKAEELYHVHGERGLDPTEPPASAPYPYPAVKHEPRIQELHDNMARMGLNPSTCRWASCSTTSTGAHAEQRVSAATAATASPASCGARRTRRSCASIRRSRIPTSTLLTDAWSRAWRRARRAARCPASTSSARAQPEAYSADVVVVSSGAINSAPLLLRSANDRHPNGLGNSSDVVGRHYMRHNNETLMAISKDLNPTTFQKTLALGDFYLRDKDVGLSAWDDPDAGQDRRHDHPRRGAALGGVHAWHGVRRDGAPLGGLLAQLGRPARCRQRVTINAQGRVRAHAARRQPGRAAPR